MFDFDFSGTHVLTAGHCCRNEEGSLSNKALVGEGTIPVDVKAVTTHPSFSPYSFRYDFCIITLVGDVTMNEETKSHVSIAKLPSKDRKQCDAAKFDHSTEALGWGYFKASKITKKTLGTVNQFNLD